MSTITKMTNHTTEIIAGIGGFLAAIIFKVPIHMVDTDINRLKIAVAGGIISAIAGWFIRLFLDKLKERYEDKKRQKEWRDKLDE